MITPLHEDGQIDLALFEKQTAYLASAGVQGFFVNGTTSEGAYLTTTEKVQTCQRLQQVKQPDQVVCAACIQPSTELVLEEMRAFEPLAPDFLVAVTPYYYDAPQDVLIRHYTMIAEASPAPVLLYNIPSCTHNPLTLATIRTLAGVNNIVGIKDSSGDFMAFSQGVHADYPSDFTWIQGEDLLDGPSLLIGAHGMVTGLGNVWIEPYIAMYQAAQAGDAAEVKRAQQQINALYEIIPAAEGQVIAAIKAGAGLLGRSAPTMKLPGLTLRTDQIERVKQVLHDIQLV